MRRLLPLAATVPVLVGCGTASRSAAPPPPSSSAQPPARAKPASDTAAATPAAQPSPARIALGLPAVPPGPVPGYVLIADRNNNRLLIVSPGKRVVWSVAGLHDPDDAFFAPGDRRIVTNEEFNETIAQIDIRSRRVVWSYGTAGVAGPGPNQLSHPDDAYVLPNRQVSVADIQNCRVLRLSPAGRIVGAIGSAGRCAHDPPRALLDPNGATPLPGGGVLVTEIGGYVDRIDGHGRLVWSVRTPTTYPSDAQLLPNGDVLVAGFNTPGRIDEITPQGRIVWTYGPTSGPGALDRPSLAVRWPNGMIAATDDWHHRIVVIDPRTKQIVWQYGHLGIASSADGYLSKPDGLDLLAAPQAASTTSNKGLTPAVSLSVRRLGVLPAPVSRLAAVALPGGRILAAGGLTAAGSSDQVLLGPPGSLRLTGRLPVPTHDAALALAGAAAYLFGGGQAASTDAVVRIDYATGAARRAGSLGEPLSDLGAVTLGGRAYLVGGYTGARYATAVLRWARGGPVLVARLPAGLRYAGVTALGGRIYVAGGLTPAGETADVLAVDPAARTVTKMATLPSPVAHAALAALGGRLYLIGGRDPAGRPLAQILSIDPASGAVAQAGRLPAPLADAAAVALGGQIVVLGGAGRAPSNAVLALRK